jgi:Xaa-Pro aminopeptidase
MRLGFSLLASLTLLSPVAFLNVQDQGQDSKPAVRYPVFENDHISASELSQRRTAVKQKMQPGSISVLFTNHEHLRNNDCDFRFRADSNFLYLTGFNEPDAALILAPNGIVIDGKMTTEVLFVNESNQMSETWLGYRMGSKDGGVLLGVQTVLPNSRFAEVLNSLKPEKVMTMPIPEGSRGMLARMNSEYKKWLGDRTTAGGMARIIGNLRAIKSDAEIQLLKKATDASVEGHIQAIKSCKPGMREYMLQAVHEYCFRKNGCEAEAYGCIVGGGANSTILHYEADRAVLKSGDLLLMDCAGEYHGYAADVTRTIPVNGKFSPAQREIYSIVLEAQKAGIRALKVGANFNAGHNAASKVIAEGLYKLGIIKDYNETGRYFMHGSSHTVGLDVHDTFIGTLQPGVVLTVEPGIYIKAGSPCDPKWWNIGVRIEDDILMTQNGPVNLSAGVPREINELEALMQGKGIADVPTDKR